MSPTARLGSRIRRIAAILALAAGAANAALPELTDAENAYIAANPVVRVGIDRAGLSPIDIVSVGGDYFGISSEVLRRVTGRMGLRMEVKPYPDQAAALAAARRREVDVVASTLHSPELASSFLFTQHYAYSHTVLLRSARAPEGEPVVAVEKGRAPPPALRQRIPAFKVRNFPDTTAALEAVLYGQAHAYAGPAIAIAAAARDLGGLATLSREDLDAGELRFAVRRDLPHLVSIFDKALGALDSNELAGVTARWLPSSAPARVPVFALREDEKRWIAAHPKLRVAFDPDFGPFTFLNSGEPSGMAIDYLRTIAGRLSMELELKSPGAFQDALAAVGKGDADVLAAAARTTLRRRDLRFAGPIYSLPTAIVTGLDSAYVSGMADLDAKTVALPAGYFLRERFAAEYPQVNVITCRDTQACLQEVVDRRAFATMGNLAVISAIIESRFPGRLKLTGTVPDAPSELFFAIRSDAPELQSLLQRALDSIPLEEHDRIRTRWRTLQYEEGISVARMLRYGLPIAAIVMLVMGIFYFANRRLSREVALRRDAEVQLRAARDRAEAATTAKSSFLAMMSHEIRTPMHGVLGILDVLSHTPLDADQRGLVRTAGGSARSLLGLLNDLLDVSKIEAGKMRIEPAPADLRLVAESALNLFALKAFDAGVRLTLFIDPAVAHSLVFDEVRVSQVLTNLASNAVKFTEKGEVRVEIAVVGERDGEQDIAIRVRDTGIGIAPEDQRKAFEAFEQAESSTTRRFGGTGLGLAICRRIADLMQGSLTLESVPGRGSTFTLTARFEVKERHAPPSGLAGIRALLEVEDAEVRADVERYLGGWNIAVKTLPESGATGMIEAFKAAAGWVVISDSTALIDVLQLRSTRSDVAAVVLRASPAPGIVHVNVRRAEISMRPLRVTTLEAAIREVFAPASVTETTARKPEQAQAARGHVLVVEDHPVNQLVIRRQLELLGLSVEIAANGAEGLERWRAGRFDLVFADHHMPVMDGEEMVRRLREEETARGGKATAVLGLSADSREAMAGIDARLLKPVETEALRRAIERFIPLGGAGERRTAPRAAREAPQTVLDERVLLEVCGSEEAARETLAAFRETLASDHEALLAALRAGRLEDARRVAHRIKGAARTVGAHALDRAAAAVEAAAQLHDAAAASNAAAELEGSRSAVLEAIEAREHSARTA